MITIIAFAFLIAGSLITLFTAGIRGLAGAIILGFNAIIVDFFWQWLRIKIMRQSQTGLWFGILGGLIVRVASIYLFVRIGFWWLGNGQINTDVSVFAVLLLTIPIWSIIASYKFKSEGK